MIQTVKKSTGKTCPYKDVNTTTWTWFSPRSIYNQSTNIVPLKETHSKMNQLERHFIQHEENHRMAIWQDTWGHIYPKLGSKQNGWIEFSLSAFGDYTIVNFQFKGLVSSPVLFEDVQDFVEAQTHLEPGCYRWQGWYKKYKNTQCQFQSTPLHRAQFPVFDVNRDGCEQIGVLERAIARCYKPTDK